METITVPMRLNVRLKDTERQAVATVIKAISTPHRRPATVTEAVRAALSIAAAQAVQGREQAETRNAI